ncbi:KU [Globodera pallida]|nr:KU [Globodera pallida]
MFCYLRMKCCSYNTSNSSSSLPFLALSSSSVFTLVIILVFHFNAVKAEQNANEKWSTSDVCELPLNLGNCTRKSTRFYYDSSRQQCYKFIYTGCRGNSNRFLTRNQCKRKCHPNFRHITKKTRLFAILQSERQNEKDQQQNDYCVKNCTNGLCANGVCQCKSGYEKRDGQCIDLNECNWINCAKNAKCTNLPGSFRCECRKGFAGGGFNCTKNRRICAQSFDGRYERQCQPDQRWVPRFYFHLRSAECRQFWYGGCQFDSSQNFFQDQKSCESVCGGYSNEEYFAANIAQNAQSVQQQQQQQQKLLDDPCMDPFDETLRQPCSEGIWKRRYHFEPSIGRCRVFWMDVSCPSPRSERSRSRNIFVHAQNCRRACEGEKEDIGHEGEQDEFWRWREWEEAWSSSKNRTTGFIQASFAKSTLPTTSSTTTAMAASTLAPVSTLGNDCALVLISDQLALAKTVQEKRERLARLKTKLGKKEPRKNEQKQLQHNTANKHGQSEACFDQFDWNLTKSCGKSRWRTRFFYDVRHGKCRPFWNDGCPGRTRNHFREEAACRKKCERGQDDMTLPQGMAAAQEVRAVVEETPSSSSSSICAQPFDDEYRRACNNGRSWGRKWYFDAMNGFCRHFWYDGCTGRSRNIFEGLKQCMDLCVHDNDFLRPDLTKRVKSQQNFGFFGSAPSTVLIPSKNYLKSSEILLDEEQCAGFHYNLTGKALLSAFLCLLEEGGGCQRTVHWATNGAEKCHFGRPWLRGRHSYAWFFTLEKGRRPPGADDELSSTSLEQQTQTKRQSIDEDDDQSPTNSTTNNDRDNRRFEAPRAGTASAVLTLRQPQQNNTADTLDTLLVPIELFGQHNETVAFVELLVSPVDQCNANTKC